MPRSKSKYTIPVPPGMSKKQLKGNVLLMRSIF